MKCSCPGAFQVDHLSGSLVQGRSESFIPISPSKFEAKQKKYLVKLLNIETK